MYLLTHKYVYVIMYVYMNLDIIYRHVIILEIVEKSAGCPVYIDIIGIK